ncbi:MAG: FAD-dependent oxidoreductase [Chthoniobacterales bacterium]
MKHLVFVGAGHAHLLPLSRTREFVREGARVTLVAPGKFWYSGMGPGMVSGFYEPGDDTVDAERLVTEGGGEFVRAEVARIDPARRTLDLRSGPQISYDVLSLNVGSEVPLEKIDGAAEHGVSVKPIKNLLALRERLTNAPGNPRVVVVGGGAAGSEVCVNLWHLLKSSGRKPQLTLVFAEDRLLTQATPKASLILRRYLEELNVRLVARSRVQQVTAHAVELADGEAIPFDALTLAIGIRPPALLHEAGLPCAEDGSMRVNAFLQSPAHPEIFGAGDCICFGKECLSRIGVYAVRQAPVLHRNLLAFLRGETLEGFSPQKNYLLILNLGDGTGLLTYGGFTARGRWAFWFKDWLDRRFVREFQQRQPRAG